MYLYVFYFVIDSNEIMKILKKKSVLVKKKKNREDINNLVLMKK